MADGRYRLPYKRGGRYCVAGAPNSQSCRNSSNTPGISMHQFPLDPDLRDQWVKFVQRNRQGFRDSRSRYQSICSAHFEDHCFEHNPAIRSVLEGTGLKLKNMLCKGAVPTLDASSNLVPADRVKVSSFMIIHCTCMYN